MFDCDGVLLDSNRVKSNAIYKTALPYGKEVAAEFLMYHQKHGGISRFSKFEHLFINILKYTDFHDELNKALDRFASHCLEGLKTCAEAPELRRVLSAIIKSGGTIFVVSGGMQSELRALFDARELKDYFQAIFGSPDSKEDILIREFAKGAMSHPAVFIGDSLYDYEAARKQNLDFIFVSDWSEFDGWRTFFSTKNVRIIANASELLT